LCVLTWICTLGRGLEKVLVYDERENKGTETTNDDPVFITVIGKPVNIMVAAGGIYLYM
jgi:hypothetical protein